MFLKLFHQSLPISGKRYKIRVWVVIETMSVGLAPGAHGRYGISFKSYISYISSLYVIIALDNAL